MGRHVTDLPVETERIHSCLIALFAPSLHGKGAERVMLDIVAWLASRDVLYHLVLVKA